MKNHVTQTRLKEIFVYDDGRLIWKKTAVPNQVSIGDEAGGISGIRGVERARIMVDGRTYLAHRLIFLFHHGFLPKIVDHINRDRLDNRLENLRAATDSQNMHNAKKRSKWGDKTTSKFKGLKWRTDRNKWRADIYVDGSRHYLGLFADEISAARAYNEAAKRMIGAFAGLNEGI